MIDWFVHPERVATPREAAALVRRLGLTRVRMTQHRTRSWVLKDPAAIQAVLRAIEPSDRTEIEFEGITREATLPFLERLVLGDAQFISIAGTTASLRVWPRRDEAAVDEHVIERRRAFERFRPACTLTWINGGVSAPGADIIACLPGLAAELDQPELDIDLEISIDAALELVLAFPDAELEWTGGAVIQFPAGEIMMYRLNAQPGSEAEWQTSIAGALAAIR